MNDEPPKPIVEQTELTDEDITKHAQDVMISSAKQIAADVLEGHGFGTLGINKIKMYNLVKIRETFRRTFGPDAVDYY